MFWLKKVTLKIENRGYNKKQTRPFSGEKLERSLFEPFSECGRFKQPKCTKFAGTFLASCATAR
ncbi:hypothetical protein CANARDRAFT_26794 [[Candida] arabinofermentans NRRL YB-2248]|uniref:Uncharacterized protein n=1 Tax=[Candida] arabinofermentans NRRL YB-2248 TaxID=983967 RepID=A0A1E4T6N2_9ASCO|nr:hypothetical protein CANARDRAFT_26794 [[Candida] arabinofermentans NRRL YB-2248]